MKQTLDDLDLLEASVGLDSSTSVSDWETTDSTAGRGDIDVNATNNNNHGGTNASDTPVKVQNEERRPSVSPASTSRSIASAHPSTHTSANKGHISLHWILAFYCGSLPADQAMYVLDWAIVNQEKYAGVYFTVALLDIFAPFLLEMTGSDINSWLERVSEGKGEWYRDPCLPQYKYCTSEGSKQGGDAAIIDAYALHHGMCWQSFVEGWIHATR